MCYIEELFVQIDDDCVFVLVLRIPERLASYLLFYESAVALKKSLNSDMMRLLRGIAAHGDASKHVHSKNFLFEVSSRESEWKKMIPQIQVGQATSTLMDKDYLVFVQLRDNIVKPESLPEVGKSFDAIESPQIATILEAATKRLDKSSCLTLSCLVSPTKATESVLPAPSPAKVSQAKSPNKQNEISRQTEVEVGPEFVVRRRKRPLDRAGAQNKSPSKATQSPPTFEKSVDANKQGTPSTRLRSSSAFNKSQEKRPSSLASPRPTSSPKSTPANKNIRQSPPEPSPRKKKAKIAIVTDYDSSTDGSDDGILHITEVGSKNDMSDSESESRTRRTSYSQSNPNSPSTPSNSGSGVGGAVKAFWSSLWGRKM